jgi:hypothetical protein
LGFSAVWTPLTLLRHFPCDFAAFFEQNPCFLIGFRSFLRRSRFGEKRHSVQPHAANSRRVRDMARSACETNGSKRPDFSCRNPGFDTTLSYWSRTNRPTPHGPKYLGDRLHENANFFGRALAFSPRISAYFQCGRLPLPQTAAIGVLKP